MHGRTEGATRRLFCILQRPNGSSAARDNFQYSTGGEVDTKGVATVAIQRHPGECVDGGKADDSLNVSECEQGVTSEMHN